MQDEPATQERRPEAGHPEHRGSLFRHAINTFGTYAAVAVLSLVNVLVVSRVLGADGRGEVAFFITVTGLTATLAGLSIQEANVNIASVQPAARPSIATNSVIFAFALGALGSAIVGVLVALFPAVGGPVGHGLLLVALAVVPLKILALNLTSLAQASYAFHAVNMAWIAGPTTTAILNSALAVAGVLTVELATAAWVLGQAIGLAIMVVFVLRHGGFGRPDRALGRRSLSFGLKTQISHILSIGNYRADQWIVGSIAGSRELGLYSVAVAWAEALSYIPGVLKLVQRPDLVRAERENAAALASWIFRVAVVLAIAVGVAFYIAAPFLCTTVFGAEFEDAVPMLRILLLGGIGLCAIDLLHSAIIAQDRPLHGSIGVGIAAVTGVVLDFLLVPSHGGVGAATAATLSYSIGGAVTAWVFVRVLRGSFGALIPQRGDMKPFWKRLVRRLR